MERHLGWFSTKSPKLGEKGIHAVMQSDNLVEIVGNKWNFHDLKSDDGKREARPKTAETKEDILTTSALGFLRAFRARARASRSLRRRPRPVPSCLTPAIQS